MQPSKWPNVTNRMGAMVHISIVLLLSASLLACGEQNRTTSPEHRIDNAEHAQNWLDAQAQSTHNATPHGADEWSQSTDYRWVRTAIAVPNSVTIFTMMNADASPLVKNKHPETSASEATSNHVLFDRDALTLDGTGFNQIPMQRTQTQSQSTTAVELAQAAPSQIKFMGLLQHEREQFGLVQVGERVYRVHTHDAIGAGAWRVLAMDETKMQLMINGKVVTYDK